MTWNIRNGGQDRHGPDRRTLLARVVAAHRPDVLALQELRGLDVARFASDAGLTPHLARSPFGQPVAILVHPRWPTTATGPVRRPFHHAAQRVTLSTDAGPLAVLSTHFYPYRGGRRLVEAGWAAAALRRSRADLALLAGDLNTLPPYADHAESLARLAPAYRRRHLRRDGRTVDTRAVAHLLAAGLVDLAATAGPTVPTGYGHTPEFAEMRLDYLLATPALAAHLVDVQVIRTPDTHRASDHHPITATFTLTPPT
ncbi:MULTISPECIES: endonuclease/exonuclease/phosphatase family protein [unclassified Micromonospora]|uniref:endonuclease/exonuclease/phosphatase family protein n=1 Tax=unclassified Micromonospora TaxID=2617518 RepID=UPI001F25FCCC|nr:endonuclease/exonuclease/phosphatase family protein [Verrucosispora sp. SN26_14.1]